MASEDVREVVPEIVATMSNATYKGEKGTFNDLTPEQKESLRGPRGYQGPQGDTGPKGATGPQGEQGPAGADGEDGITPEITVSNITGGHTISISYGVEDPRNSSFNIMDGTNGSNGSAGQNGSDGITPIITAITIAGGHNISISYGTDDPRNTSFDVLDGQDGAAGADGQDGVDGAPGADGPAGADGVDGITPDITVTSITGGHTVTIDYGSGDSRNTSFNVMDGATGATGPAGTYTAGTGISINNGQISLSSNPVPTISNGDAGKVLAVNSGETGVEWATPASGGSSYTAGDGIYIDQNDVISNTQQSAIPPNMTYNWSSVSTKADFIARLKMGKIAYTHSNLDNVRITPAEISAGHSTIVVVGNSISNNAVKIDRGQSSIALLSNKYYYLAQGDNEDTLYRMDSPDGLLGIIPISDSFGQTYLPTIKSLIGAKQNKLPAYTNNAGKILAVNSNADNVEWITAPSSGGGSSGPSIRTIALTGYLNNTGKTTVANMNADDVAYINNFINAERNSGGSGMELYPLQFRMTGLDSTFFTFAQSKTGITFDGLYYETGGGFSSYRLVILALNSSYDNNTNSYQLTSYDILRCGSGSGWTVSYGIDRTKGLSTDSLVYYSGSTPYSLTTFLGNLKAQVPDPPTTDGTYTLQVTVSSGTPTYSWV